jgi:hypothetical protein
LKEPDESFEFIATFDSTKYYSDVKKFKDLWNWKINRNKARSAAEDEVGYDVKHGAHLLRLMFAGKQILSSGEFSPKLEGKELERILDVLHFKVKYDDLIEQAEKIDSELDFLYNVSNIRHSPDVKKLNDLLIALSDTMLNDLEKK